MDQRELKDQAWIGDAVLALFVRQWLLDQPPHPKLSIQQRFTLFTSNAFLQRFGEPTKVEATIGRIYVAQGLNAAFAHISNDLLPTFVRLQAKAANR
jgi:hypothetical protein